MVGSRHLGRLPLPASVEYATLLLGMKGRTHAVMSLQRVPVSKCGNRSSSQPKEDVMAVKKAATKKAAKKPAKKARACKPCCKK